MESAKLWSARPFEELYDIEQDPHELTNLANDAAHARAKGRLAKRLKDWILETRDSGFASELEMLRRSQQKGIAPYTWAQDPKRYPLEAALNAADAASRPDGEILSAADEPILTYWAVQQRLIRGDRSKPAVVFFQEQLESESPAVRLAAAEGLARAGEKEAAIPVFEKALATGESWVQMQAARSLAISLDDVRPLEKTIRSTLSKIAEEEKGKKYRDWSVSTRQALHYALIKSGIESSASLGLN